MKKFLLIVAIILFGAIMSASEVTHAFWGCPVYPYPGDNLSGINLSNMNLSLCDFTGVNLTNANLENSYVTYANFNDAILVNANLSGITGTKYTDFSNANLSNTNLTGAYLAWSFFDDATGIPFDSNSSSNFINVTCPNGTVQSSWCWN